MAKVLLKLLMNRPFGGKTQGHKAVRIMKIKDDNQLLPRVTWARKTLKSTNGKQLRSKNVPKHWFAEATIQTSSSFK